MADNTTLNPGTGGDIIRAEEKGGSKTQVMLLDIGGIGAESLVDGSNPLPVTVGNFPGTYAVTGTFWQATQPVSGTVTANAGTGTFNIAAASLPLPTGAATAAGLTTINTTLGTPFQAGGSIGNTAFGISGTLPAFASTPTFNIGTIGGAASAANQTTTNTKLDSVITALGTPLQAGGNVGVSGSVAVTGTFWQATQPVSAASLPLPAGAATETTLAAVNAKLPTLITANPGATDPALTVAQRPVDIWSATFASVGTFNDTLNPKFTLRRLGTGVTASQASGSLAIAAGTTANAEFLARSVDTFSGAFIHRLRIALSQRIANNNFAVMLADQVGEGLAYNCTSATVVDVTLTAHGYTAVNIGQAMNLGGLNVTTGTGVPGRYVIASIPDANTIRFTVAGWATGTGTLDLFGWNYYRSLYTGVAATSVAVDAQRQGWASGDTTATINTTAGTGHILQLAVDGRGAYWSDTLAASATTPTVATRASRYENLPEPTVPLYLYMWSFNGTTAPASGTTFTVGFVSMEDTVNNPVYLAGVRPTGQAAPLPVSLPVMPALVAGAANIGNTNLAFTTSVADIASAIITSTTTLAAVTPGFGIAYQVNIPVTVVGGTNPTMDVRIEESDDGGTNWFTVYDFPRITAVGIYRSPLIPVNGNRVRYVQTIGGASATFTRAINRLQSNYPALSVRQLIDRTTILPNTLGSTTPILLTRDCGNATQLVVNMGAITTTAPQFQLEGSEDFGATWYAIGSPLTGVASSTVQQTVNSINAAALRVRVSTAGVGATLGYVMMKAHD